MQSVLGLLSRLPLKLTYDLTDYAINHNLTPFISMQNHYSVLYREEEREMMPTHKVIPLFCPSLSWYS